MISKHSGLLFYSSGSTTQKGDAGRAGSFCSCKSTHSVPLQAPPLSLFPHTRPASHHSSPLLPSRITFSLWPSCLPLLQISVIMCRAHQDKPGTSPAPGFFTLLYLQNHSFCMRWRFTCPGDYNLDIFWKGHYSDCYTAQPKNCTYLTPKWLAI